MNACTICLSPRHHTFRNTLLRKYDVAYFHCDTCGLLQTETPYWLDEAYSEAISDADTGLVQRNMHLSRRLSALLCLMFGKDGRYADFAGGTGLLVRMMRDIGFDFYWQDPYCRNIHARGFEFVPTSVRINAITAFEVLEHLPDPLPFIADALRQTGAGTFIFTTELFQGPPPAPGEWWYYAPETGQHISFYQHRTLRKMAGQLGLRYYSHNGLHMMTRKQISPVLFRLAAGKPSALLFPLIRRTLVNKTMTDHQEILNRPQHTPKNKSKNTLTGH